jgi:hypothetical protein
MSVTSVTAVPPEGVEYLTMRRVETGENELRKSGV